MTVQKTFLRKDNFNESLEAIAFSVKLLVLTYVRTYAAKKKAQTYAYNLQFGNTPVCAQ